MLFHSKDDGLDPVRGIFNAVLLTFYAAALLAAGILLWAAIGRWRP